MQPITAVLIHPVYIAFDNGIRLIDVASWIFWAAVVGIVVVRKVRAR